MLAAMIIFLGKIFANTQENLHAIFALFERVKFCKIIGKWRYISLCLPCDNQCCTLC